jgi:dynein heavy chain
VFGPRPEPEGQDERRQWAQVHHGLVGCFGSFGTSPQQARLAARAESDAKVNALNAKLAVKQKELKEAQDKVNRLNKEIQETIDAKEKLEKEYDECSKQLVRAVKLIDNLGGEKGRWGELAQELK